MIAELGQIFLISAFSLFLVHLILSLKVLISKNYNYFYEASETLFFISNLVLLIPFLLLMYSYYHSDFSLLNIYNNSHTSKPIIYKISGTWGNHEGSLMMWLAMLGSYGILVVSLKKNIPTVFSNYLLTTITIVNLGFVGFTIFTSNPFERIFPIPDEGLGLNPVLQDPGLAFHPPLLYLGYVGLTIPFAFSIAALMTGKIDKLWAKWVKPWILVSWIFLTIGITLGSWWAYYELGWGGWWFWDPVENISLLPWLLTTALLHSIIVTEKKGNLKSWTILLCILSFSLTLLGTFIVRSGLLTSVHAFASDPARGVYILTFLFIVTGLSLTIYSVKYDRIEDNNNVTFLSREGGLLLNNIFFCSAAITILLGTLWPLLIEMTTGKDISVGAPFFNTVFLPLVIPAIYLGGISVNTNWKYIKSIDLVNKLWKAIVIFIFLMTIYYFLIGGPILLLVGVSLSLWIIISIFNNFIDKVKDKNGKGVFKYKKVFRISRSTYAMYLAHLGVGVLILGITISVNLKLYYEGIIKKGEKVNIAGYTVTLKDILRLKEKNWIADKGFFHIKKDADEFAMEAERRVYLDTKMPSTEAAIKRTFFNHLYIVMGQEQPLGSGKRIVRIYFNPSIILIWFGAIIMALGGVIALSESFKGKLKKDEVI